MSKKGKRILLSLFVVILLIVLIVCSNIYAGKINVSKVNIKVSYGISDTIVLANNINESLKNEFGDFLQKQRKDINQKQIENFLMRNPYIEQAQVYQTLKGVLNIEIKQREPIVRIYTLRNKEYYIDKFGKIILIDNNQLTDVVVASGNIDVNNSNLDKNLDAIDIENKKGFDKTLSNIYYIAQKLASDSILNYQIDQIYVPAKGNYELIPKIGNYIIRIGENKDLEEELIKLRYLYKEAFSRNGWDNYSMVDLRFRHQVVCTKKGGVETTIDSTQTTTQKVN
ncbi:MAG: cell division protein FtsQ [Bacteroidetes bacterium]|nr:cell division protein FtsQ [Bacteroidota bacterium]